MAKDTEYVLKTEVLNHTGGTKKYGLVTLIDPSAYRGAGLQLWGPSDRFKDHKFVTGSVANLASVMNAKRQEKMKSRKDGSYQPGAEWTETNVGPAAIALVRNFLVTEGCDVTMAKELADQLFREIGDNDDLDEALSAEVAEATAAANKARAEAAEVAAAKREAAYDGTWGAW